MEQRPARPGVSDVARVRVDHPVGDVLIVDDHPLMCDALSATLGYAFGLRKVRVAASLGAALANIREEGPPDAVVLDLDLPDARASRACSRCAARVDDAPLTVISADFDPALVSAAIGGGARGYVGKQLPRAKMVEAFEPHVGRRDRGSGRARAGSLRGRRRDGDAHPGASPR